MHLIILSNGSTIDNAFELRIYQKQETGVKSLILEYYGLLVDSYKSIVVYISHSSSNCKILTNSAVTNFKLTAVLDIENSTLVSVILEENAIVEVCINLLIVRKCHRASA